MVRLLRVEKTLAMTVWMLWVEKRNARNDVFVLKRQQSERHCEGVLRD